MIQGVQVPVNLFQKNESHFSFSLETEDMMDEMESKLTTDSILKSISLIHRYF